MSKRYEKLTPEERLARVAALLAEAMLRQLRERKERRPDVGPTAAK